MLNYAIPKDEPQFVMELSRGNLLAFNTLFRRYSGRLYRFSYCYLKSNAEAEELVQEVFTIIWEKRETLREDLSFKSFLFTIAFNIIRKHFRTKAYLAEFYKTEAIPDFDMQTPQKTTYDSLYRYLNELINQLPARRKEIFIKSRLEGLNIKEISEELKISHKTVENQLTDALKFIRVHLTRENTVIYIILYFLNI